MPDLTALRADLDAIDDALHELVMRRAAIVQGVAGQPGRIRPGREAAILRRLLARHHGALPDANLVRLWRELLAGSLAVQGRFSIATSPQLAAVAREHFGALAPLLLSGGPDEALAGVRAGAATVAVVPWPDGSGTAWWPGLRAEGAAPLFVIARLPFWRPRPAGAPSEPALAVAGAPPDASGQDRSLVALPRDAAPVLAARGLVPAAVLSTARDAEPWVIAELEGIIADTDARLAGLSACVLGGYACPIAEGRAA